MIEPFSFIFFFRWDDDYLFGANRNSSLPGNTRLFPRANETHTHTQNLQLRQTGKKKKTYTHTHVSVRDSHTKRDAKLLIYRQRIFFFFLKQETSFPPFSYHLCPIATVRFSLKKNKRCFKLGKQKKRSSLRMCTNHFAVPLVKKGPPVIKPSRIFIK